jgi:hypothetical protein
MSNHKENSKSCKQHSDHAHKHGENCGHKAVKHGDHTDYEHDGHLHRVHGDHVDECQGPK